MKPGLSMAWNLQKMRLQLNLIQVPLKRKSPESN